MFFHSRSLNPKSSEKKNCFVNVLGNLKSFDSKTSPELVEQLFVSLRTCVNNVIIRSLDINVFTVREGI